MANLCTSRTKVSLASLGNVTDAFRLRARQLKASLMWMSIEGVSGRFTLLISDDVYVWIEGQCCYRRRAVKMEVGIGTFRAIQGDLGINE
jgi:hypothetical protein